jgi:chemotaxis protein CheD
MDKIAGIGDYVISNSNEDTLKTFALGSCVAVTAYCSKNKVAGLIHMALPSPLNADSNPKKGYYVVTGLPALLQKMCTKYGCQSKDITVGIFGGASRSDNDIFRIGERNIKEARDLLNKMGYAIQYSNVGGSLCRTIYIDVPTGNITLITQPIQ